MPTPKDAHGAATPAKLGQRDRLSFLFKDSVVYGGAMAISRAFSIISFPLVARQLSVTEYGTLDLFLVLSMFLSTLLIFGQDSAVGRYFYEYEGIDERRQVISQSLLIQAIVCVAALAVMLMFTGRVASLVSSTPNAPHYLTIILFQMPFMIAINFAQNLLKWTFARRSFLIMSIGYAAAQAGLLVISAIWTVMDVETVLMAILLANILFGVVGLYLTREWLAWPSRPFYMRELLKFAAPIGVICVLGAAVPMVERLSIERLLGVGDLGLYAAGSKVAMLLALVIGSFQTAWGPFSISIHREPDAPQTYNLVLAFFSLAVCVFAMMLDSIAEPLLTLLATEKFSPAAIVVFPLTMAATVQSISWITEIGFGLSKRTNYVIIPYVIYLAGIAAFMSLLIPLMGLMGAALAMMLAQIARSLTSTWLAQRVYPLPWIYGWVVTVLSGTLLAGAVARGVAFPWGGFPAMLAVYILASATICVGFWRWQMDNTGRAHVLGMLRRLRPAR